MYNVVGMSRNKLRGFTLIELLIAITLMAMVSAAVAVKIGPSSRQSARDAQRRVDINAIAGALEMYRNDLRTYPLTLGLMEPGYITLPKDPTTNNDYLYIPGAGPPYRTFQLCADEMERPPAADYCVTNP